VTDERMVSTKNAVIFGFQSLWAFDNCRPRRLGNRFRCNHVVCCPGLQLGFQLASLLLGFPGSGAAIT